MKKTMTEQSTLAEKIHMFYNLLYHIDDYIKHMQERKGQLRVSKNIRLVLREIIYSKKNLNYFINKEELEAYQKSGLFEHKTPESILREREYIRKVKPLSFNQKNFSTINLFYNSTNEIYVLNYFSIEKIFKIINFCFNKVILDKQKEYINKIESDKSYKNFILINDDYEPKCNKKKKISINLIRNKINYVKPLYNFSNRNNINIFYSSLKIKNMTNNKTLNRNSSLPLINIKKQNIYSSCYGKRVLIPGNSTIIIDENQKISNYKEKNKISSASIKYIRNTNDDDNEADNNNKPPSNNQTNNNIIPRIYSDIIRLPQIMG